MKSGDLVVNTIAELPEEVQRTLETALAQLGELVGSGLALEDLQELMRSTFMAGVRMGIELCEGRTALRDETDYLGDN